MHLDSGEKSRVKPLFDTHASEPGHINETKGKRRGSRVVVLVKIVCGQTHMVQGTTIATEAILRFTNGRGENTRTGTETQKPE